MSLATRINSYLKRKSYKSIHRKYRNFTMIPPGHYIENLLLCSAFKDKNGVYVECGVWKGGMTAGIAEVLGNNFEYHLFDSFEGLPDAQEIDGQEAIEWQKNTSSPGYYDNCKAEYKDAETAMKISGVEKFHLHKGWFNETLPIVTIPRIDILRIDGDWYNSVMICLEYLYPKITKGGIIILDDYYTWDGCSRATHDFLSKKQSVSRIHMFNNSIAYIIKKD